MPAKRGSDLPRSATVQFSTQILLLLVRTCDLIAGDLVHRVTFPPCFVAAGQGAGIPPLLDQHERRTGTASLRWSGAVKDGELLFPLFLDPLGDVVEHDPDAARDGAGITPVLRTAPHIEHEWRILARHKAV